MLIRTHFLNQLTLIFQRAQLFHTNDVLSVNIWLKLTLMLDSLLTQIYFLNFYLIFQVNSTLIIYFFVRYWLGFRLATKFCCRQSPSTWSHLKKQGFELLNLGYILLILYLLWVQMWWQVAIEQTLHITQYALWLYWKLYLLRLIILYWIKT